MLTDMDEFLVGNPYRKQKTKKTSKQEESENKWKKKCRLIFINHSKWIKIVNDEYSKPLID